MICERCFEEKDDSEFPKKNKCQFIKIVCFDCLEDSDVNQGHHLKKWQKRDKRSDKDKIYSYNGDDALYCQGEQNDNRKTKKITINRKSKEATDKRREGRIEKVERKRKRFNQENEKERTNRVTIR